VPSGTGTRLTYTEQAPISMTQTRRSHVKKARVLLEKARRELNHSW